MKKNSLLLALTCLFNFALSAYIVNLALVLVNGDKAEVDWSFASSCTLLFKICIILKAGSFF